MYEIGVQGRFRSFKFRKNGLRYLIAVCIKTGSIVWIDGPFPAGKYNDLLCLRWSLLAFSDDKEQIEGDDGFIGECPKHVKCPGSFTAEPAKAAMQQRVRNRHETVNKRMKQFTCLQT